MTEFIAPDMKLAERFLASHSPHGRVLVCAITGSHMYGFPSPDSDLDIKGIHIAPTRLLLGMDAVRETHDRLQIFEGAECDLTTNEVGRALKLLAAGNGNMLERIFSPFQVVDTPELHQIRAMTIGLLSQRFHRHYAGFFMGVCKEHGRSEKPTAKALLYTYRVALTGVHLLRTGELIGDLRELAPKYGFPEALELITLKAESVEKATISADEDARHRANWPKLEAAIHAAKDESPLSPEPTNLDALGDWLVELRLDEVRRD